MRATSTSLAPNESIIRTASSIVITEPAIVPLNCWCVLSNRDRFSPDLIVPIAQAGSADGIADQ